MTSAASCGTIPLPPMRSKPTLPAIPSTKRRRPGLTRRALPSAPMRHSWSDQNEPFGMLALATASRPHQTPCSDHPSPRLLLVECSKGFAACRAIPPEHSADGCCARIGSALPCCCCPAPLASPWATPRPFSARSNSHPLAVSSRLASPRSNSCARLSVCVLRSGNSALATRSKPSPLRRSGLARHAAFHVAPNGSHRQGPYRVLVASSMSVAIQ